MMFRRRYGLSEEEAAAYVVELREALRRHT